MIKNRIALLITITLMQFVTMTSCAQKKDYIVKIKTDMGEMVAVLYDETPKHKENFIKLAHEHYYDSLLFHRVISGFMIQGGDPDSKRATVDQALGSGGPGYTVDAEIRPDLFHEKGALAAARLGDIQNPSKASSGSQFYIVQGSVIGPKDAALLNINQNEMRRGMQAFFQDGKNKELSDSLSQIYANDNMDAYTDALVKLAPRIEKETSIKIIRDVPEAQLKAYTTVGGAPHLDGEYTVFGKVIKGLDVIDKIAQAPKGHGDRPISDIRFSVSVEELPRAKITKLYGYIYPNAKSKKGK